jgi:Tol biopolymer transport system component/DNA-binding winged helix-turn-helix (wHTH) protein
MNTTTPRTALFGPYTVDLRSGELRKHGTKVKMGEQPFQILLILLRNPGELVTREELRANLWPQNTFVDFDHGLNSAVQRLRDCLSDTAERPQWVETIPRRGYRFVGQVEWAGVGLTPVNGNRVELPGNRAVALGEEAPTGGSYSSQERDGGEEFLKTISKEAPTRSTHGTWVKVVAGILATLFCSAGVVIAYRWLHHKPRSEQARLLTPLPFTALPGVETSPAFSPDGSRIAFAWNGDPSSGDKGFDLYVKGIGSETMLRLTQHPSEWLSPVWSPDGTQIAFHRMAGADTGIYMIPALGGPERKLRSTHVPYAVAAPISWSPDGKWIAFGDPLSTEPADRIFLLSLDTLESRPIPHNPKCRHEAVPTFSHSGAELAYVCVVSTNELELIVIKLADGSLKTVASVSDYMDRFTWAADDSKLVLSKSTSAGPELYEAEIAEGVLRRLPLPSNAEWPAVSSQGDKLAYSASSDSVNVWRRDLLNPELSPVKLISSTQNQNQAQYSPDGKHIAFHSTRAGPWELWMSDADGTNLVQLSKMEVVTGISRWSADSKQIVFQSKPKKTGETYIVDISERVPRKLFTNSLDTATPSWSHDGKWIYFRSHEAFGHKLYRCPSSGGEKVQVSADPDSIGPMESPDGHDVYFAERELNALLMKVSLGRPNSEPLAKGLPRVSSWTLWTIAGGGIYFVPADAPRSLCYFDLATKQIRELFKVEKDFDDGLSVSTDGRWLLYSQVDQQNSDIMIVDHFR